ncbi:GPW/gp25 family protein [cf. Phormidesmis sp. LEGE 11477]|uniref:GPW/gp25 family protein n=1 Tax=cf. Phormidesmis sp. LEGE 11477 TaxID=1828680 RepID=UPI00187F4E4D|nr:GPW/gp25 family protein [cf. Phormidesmis sp. LEGE 11477]MBE9060434.1 GPW/gp25 family protein [cf. Phormidesmis sp. LEGE 11477]
MPDSQSDLLKREEAFWGRGIAFPIRTTVQGELQLSAYDANIAECIQLILRTDLGERLYRPDFGSRLSELVFAPLNTQTLLLLRLYVEEALEKWEPRINLLAVTTDPDPQQGRVDVLISYTPKDSPDARSLVYPFYLMPASERALKEA